MTMTVLRYATHILESVVFKGNNATDNHHHNNNNHNNHNNLCLRLACPIVRNAALALHLG